MGATAPLIAVVGGFILLLICVIAVVLLCHMALRRGRQAEGEIKVRSMTFKLRVK